MPSIPTLLTILHARDPQSNANPNNNTTPAQSQPYPYGYGNRPGASAGLSIGIIILIVILAVILALLAWVTIFRLRYGFWGFGCCCRSRESRLAQRRGGYFPPPAGGPCPVCRAPAPQPGHPPNCNCAPLWVPVRMAPDGTAFAVSPGEHAVALEAIARRTAGDVAMREEAKRLEAARGGQVAEFFPVERTPAVAPREGYYAAEVQGGKGAEGMMLQPSGQGAATAPTAGASRAGAAGAQAEIQPANGPVMAPVAPTASGQAGSAGAEASAAEPTMADAVGHEEQGAETKPAKKGIKGLFKR